MKKIIIAFIVLIFPIVVNAQNEPITVYMFRGEGCGYCKKAIEFFDSIQDEYRDYFTLKTYEVWYDDDNAELMKNVSMYFNEDTNGVPYIIIGNKTFQGYAETYNEEIIEAIKKAYDDEKYIDVIEYVKNNDVTKEDDIKLGDDYEYETNNDNLFLTMIKIFYRIFSLLFY